MSTPGQLEKVQELHEFLQGRAPKGYKCQPPDLDKDTAWTVVWFIQNQYHQYSDTIERCELCGLIYDSERGGICLDYGEEPYHFCEDCTFSAEFEEKQAADPRLDRRRAALAHQ